MDDLPHDAPSVPARVVVEGRKRHRRYRRHQTPTSSLAKAIQDLHKRLDQEASDATVTRLRSVAVQCDIPPATSTQHDNIGGVQQPLIILKAYDQHNQPVNLFVGTTPLRPPRKPETIDLTDRIQNLNISENNVLEPLIELSEENFDCDMFF